MRLILGLRRHWPRRSESWAAGSA